MTAAAATVAAMSLFQLHMTPFEIEWMWADAGIHPKVARMNPLRRSSGSLAAIIGQLKEHDRQAKDKRGRAVEKGKGRPVTMRVRGNNHTFGSAGEAWRWLDETQGDGTAAESHWWQSWLEDIDEFQRDCGSWPLTLGFLSWRCKLQRITPIHRWPWSRSSASMCIG